MLTDAQRRQYETEGWLSVAGLVDADWLERLRRITAEFVDASRAVTESNVLYDLDEGHSAEDPRLRRLTSPTDLHDEYWEFASRSVLADVAADLLGPDVKVHHSKLNFKAPRGGEEVKWHHDGDEWVGALGDDDVDRAGVDRARYPVGPAGTITVHNCRTVHGSAPNSSDRPRPLLLQTYAAADAFAYTDLVRRSPHGEELIRGRPARWARHDPRPCLMPPTGPYRPIFAVQQRETPQ
jgi:ectoine hydroxylase